MSTGDIYLNKTYFVQSPTKQQEQLRNKYWISIIMFDSLEFPGHWINTCIIILIAMINHFLNKIQFLMACLDL